MDISYKLKTLRERENIKQKDMASLLHMTVSTYNRKENGCRYFTIEEAHKLAKFFNTTIEEIFTKGRD